MPTENGSEKSSLLSKFIFEAIQFQMYTYFFKNFNLISSHFSFYFFSLLIFYLEPTYFGFHAVFDYSSFEIQYFILSHDLNLIYQHYLGKYLSSLQPTFSVS
ncbi:unnamed protein product [Schistosoma rodhaini]|nr:unnamed protein product [Schistosoma rodhaini]